MRTNLSYEPKFHTKDHVHFICKTPSRLSVVLQKQLRISSVT